MPKHLAASSISSQFMLISNRERSLQKLSQEIEQFSQRMLHISETARYISEETRIQLGFDFAAVQLIDPEEQSIQTVSGSGFGDEWYKISKHSLECNAEFRDIQADISLANPPRLEIITGWDPRFDEFIYKEFGHRHYTRAWAPLIVVRNSTGHLAEVRPDQFGFEPVSDGSSRVIRLPPKDTSTTARRSFEIIGTLEAGFDNSDTSHLQDISNNLARMLFRKACQSAQIMYRSSLLYILELVTDSVKKLSRADCASLHFPLDTSTHRFANNVWLGPPSSRELQPRKGGLGERVINTEKPRSIVFEKKTSEEFNPAVHTAGIKAYAAFPLIFRGRQQPVTGAQQNAASNLLRTGVLYIAFKRTRVLTKKEMGGLQPFITLALDAIRNVAHHAQALNSARQLESLHDIAGIFASEVNNQRLLRSVAGHTLSILAADLVMIYLYNSAQSCFTSPAITAGRRKNAKSEPGYGLDNYVPPPRLAAQEESLYAVSTEQAADLYGDMEQKDIVADFLKEEGIEAAAVIPIRLGKETIGVLLVNYRHPHTFLSHEKKLAETLASTAAVAIWNRRSELTAPQIRNKAVQEVCGLILHDFQPVIGILDFHAAREVAGYEISSVKKQVDLLRKLVIAIKGVYTAAAAVPQRCAFDLAELIRGVVAESTRGHGIEISLIGPAPMHTEADPHLLRLAISNGLRNAIEAVSASQTDGHPNEIVVNWGLTGNETWLTILDNGPGLHVGGPFELGTSSKDGHSGLGLSISRLAIATMGGDIRLKNNKGGGAHFEICW